MNSNLQNAKKQKNDEFYTRLCDIENEVNKYWMSDLGGNPDVFKDKIVYLNCDSIESNFWQYFGGDFKLMHLKKIISTCIDGYKLEYDGSIPFDDFKRDWEKYKTKINGDFRSDECVDILKECDVVVTNPPFSLFREYVSLLMRYEKKFLIIGNINAITYKEIFPLIKDNKLWAGYGFNLSMVYKTTYKNELEANVKFVKSKGLNPDDGYVKVPGICWFTNLDVKKRHEELYLVCEYNEIDYPKYDNYDAIEVSKTVNIPKDYYGVMGVPISFLDKYNPSQFEIIKFRKGNDDKDLNFNGNYPYFRILIRRK